MALRPPPSVSSPSFSHPGITGAQQRAGGVQCPARVAARSSPASFLGTGSRTRQDEAGRGRPQASWGQGSCWVGREAQVLLPAGAGERGPPWLCVLGEDLGDSWAVGLGTSAALVLTRVHVPRCCLLRPLGGQPGAMLLAVREQGQPGARAVVTWPQRCRTEPGSRGRLATSLEG